MSFLHFVFGRLGPDSLPFWDMLQHPTRETIVNGVIATTAASVVVIGAAAVVFLITWYGQWKVFWSEWLTSVDHKRIGIMYIVLSFVMLTRAIVEAGLMRAQQAFGLDGGFLSPHHFGQLFSTHGTIMIFFMAMPFLTGVINYVMPLQIGARDVSFPVMNSISLGLTAAGAAIVMISLAIGKFSTGGWSGYPPFTEVAFNPGPGPDYWIWAVTLSSLGSMMTGINFAVTIYKRRAPGMSLLSDAAVHVDGSVHQHPHDLCYAAADRRHRATCARPLSWLPLLHQRSRRQHDELRQPVLAVRPSRGLHPNIAVIGRLFGSVLYLFGKGSLRLYVPGARYDGYRRAVVYRLGAPLLHDGTERTHQRDVRHCYNADRNTDRSEGVRLDLTMFRGCVRFTVPMVYALGFMMLFVLGGLTGIILANPSVDYQVHNTLFLVAHFHNMLIPGLLFGMLAAYHFWFPKAFGFRLDERWGMISAICWILGFIFAFFPLYALGFLGFPRRTVSYIDPTYLPFMIVAFVGAGLVVLALGALFVQLWVSVRNREENRVPAGDPWDGRSIEWATSAPPPEYNFSLLPHVTGRDAFMRAKQSGNAYRHPTEFFDIKMPKNSAMGMILCVTSGLVAFGLVWYLWWLVVAAGLAAFAAIVGRGFARDTKKIIPASEVERAHMRWLAIVAASRPISRALEVEPANVGLASHPIREAAE